MRRTNKNDITPSTSDKTPIEITLQIDKDEMTTLSKLYDFLEINPSNYSRWCRKNIINNPFAKASVGDMTAISELNELRRFAMEPVLLQEIKLLGIYGTYKPLGYNESCEVEITDFANLPANEQALGQDVKFPVIRKKRVPITTTTISGGYAVDYRKAALGDMSDENTLQDQVRVQIRNKAALYVMRTVYNALKNATGVKYA